MSAPASMPPSAETKRRTEAAADTRSERALAIVAIGLLAPLLGATGLLWTYYGDEVFLARALGSLPGCF